MSDLHKALVKAQGQLKNPAMDSENPHFRSKFASLKSVREAVIPVFNKAGLAVVQKSAMADGGLAINTVILHEGGEEMDCGTLFIPVRNDNPQSYCSAMTYARRYTLQAVAGVVGDPDDDGNAASKTEGRVKAEGKKESKGGNYKFLQSIKGFKEKIGEERYYKIIGGHGYEHANEITKREHQIAVFKELEMTATAVEEME